MLSWSYKGGFFGNYLCVGKMIASIAQGTSPCAQSARRQRPCCRHFRRCISSFKMNMHLTQVALVARPCAPDAQRVEDSSSSRSRLAKSYGRFAPLDLRQDCFFRVSLPKVKFPIQSACGGQADFVYSFIHREATFRQLSKAADASQPLGFDKQSSLR